VLRTGRKDIAAATLILDAVKGTVAVLLGSYFGEAGALAAAFGAYVGHCFPVWLKFKGGKGVATFLGVLLALHWPTMIATAVIWLGTAAATRYSSLSALVASVAAPILLVMLRQNEIAALCAVLTLLIWIKHRENLKRLLAGEESRIGAK
jgi:glycerol-3-phosphate acyltransferase PlsY